MCIRVFDVSLVLLLVSVLFTISLPVVCDWLLSDRKGPEMGAAIREPTAWKAWIAWIGDAAFCPHMAIVRELQAETSQLGHLNYQVNTSLKMASHWTNTLARGTTRITKLNLG